MRTAGMLRPKAGAHLLHGARGPNAHEHGQQLQVGADGQVAAKARGEAQRLVARASAVCRRPDNPQHSSTRMWSVCCGTLPIDGSIE